jgi:hypothetical protein
MLFSSQEATKSKDAAHGRYQPSQWKSPFHVTTSLSMICDFSSRSGQATRSSTSAHARRSSACALRACVQSSAIAQQAAPQLCASYVAQQRSAASVVHIWGSMGDQYRGSRTASSAERGQVAIFAVAVDPSARTRPHLITSRPGRTYARFLIEALVS